MKLANGYGSITKMSGNRRKKWRVFLPYKDSDRMAGKPRQTLGYYRTKSEALQALAEYHKDPEIFLYKETTFSDVYEMWSANYFQNISYSQIRSYKTAFKHCALLQNMPINEIRLYHLQNIIDSLTGGYRKKENVKILMQQVSKFALLNDMVKKSYVQGVVIGERESTHKKNAFTNEEIQILWDNSSDNFYVKCMLILLYTGMRKGELFKLKRENIHIDERYFVGGSKTRAGKNRTIPICEKILPIMQEFYENSKDKKNFLNINFSMYERELTRTFKKLNLNHTAHELRHTFGSLMQRAGVPLFTTQRIMGHATGNITQDIYTHIDLAELLEAVNKI